MIVNELKPSRAPYLKVLVHPANGAFTRNGWNEIRALSKCFNRHFSNIKQVDWHLAKAGQRYNVTCLVETENGCYCVTAAARVLPLAARMAFNKLAKQKTHDKFSNPNSGERSCLQN